MGKLQKHVQRLANEYEAAEAAGLPIVELGKRLMAARERLAFSSAPIQLCTCVPEQLGDGPCPVCGHEMCPF